MSIRRVVLLLVGGYVVLAAAVLIGMWLLVEQGKHIEQVQRDMIELVARSAREDCEDRNELRAKFDNPGEFQDCDARRDEYLALLQEL